jgi:predicted glycogen debranching enzyme
VKPAASWSGLADGPWPRIVIAGELERAEREWLHTNGAGAFAMSTVALMHTRRQHGVLIAALDPPLGRHVILSHAESSVTVGDRTYKLSTHQFPGVAPTHGYRLLSEFCQDPIPRWIFKLGKSVFERTLCLVRGENSVILGYTWKGRGTARLSVMPLLPLRPLHELAREHGAMAQTVVLRPGAVEIRPLPKLPPIIFGHPGVFMGSPDWWRRFEYVDDHLRYTDHEEDMWTPGTFELTLEPGVTRYLVCAVGALPEGEPKQQIEKTRAHLLAQDPGGEHEPTVRALSVSAEAYCADDCARPAIIAGYPWHEAFTRDALIALPGLYLLRGRIEAAERVLETLLAEQRAGLLPDRLPWDGHRGQRSPDATLWLFHASAELLERGGAERPWLNAVLYPALRRAFVRLRGIRAHARSLVWTTDDGLLATSAPDRPLTWMDAQLGAWLVTPRRGLAIEHQALWIRACDVLCSLAEARGDLALLAATGNAARRAREAFRARFWCNETAFPFDCLSERSDTADAWADPSIRPNAVIAAALVPDLFDAWQLAAIVERAREELVTSRGLRSLSPRDRAYRGHYEGSHDEREGSYHQGTAWTFLLGAYARSLMLVDGNDFERMSELESLIRQAADGGPVLGHVVQIADGEEPHRVRGCPAQAWSVAELLRTLMVDLARS